MEDLKLSSDVLEKSCCCFDVNVSISIIFNAQYFALSSNNMDETQAIFFFQLKELRLKLNGSKFIHVCSRTNRPCEVSIVTAIGSVTLALFPLVEIIIIMVVVVVVVAQVHQSFHTDSRPKSTN